MAKKVAVLAVNSVDGFGLSQYLEGFFGNGIPHKAFAVSDTQEIKINSSVTLFADDVIVNLKGYEDKLDAPVFVCGDAVPIFKDNAGKAHNVDLMEATEVFGEKGKLMIGYCAAATMSNFTGTIAGKRPTVYPLAKPAIQTGQATDGKSEIDGNFYTAQDENTLWIMMPQLIGALEK